MGLLKSDWLRDKQEGKTETERQSNKKPGGATDLEKARRGWEREKGAWDLVVRGRERDRKRGGEKLDTDNLAATFFSFPFSVQGALKKGKEKKVKRDKNLPGLLRLHRSARISQSASLDSDAHLFTD